MSEQRSVPVRESERRERAERDARTTKRTLCRDAEAEARVAQDLARLAAAIDGELGRALQALLLLGTYARGEGSVIERRGELQACSCYELLAVVDRLPHRGTRALERIAATWSDRLGVDVHLTATTLRELERATAALTWVDASAGQVEVLAGDASVLGRLRPLHPKDVSSESWASMLCDAAVDVADANLDGVRRARFGPRDLHEAVLACGDALLLETGRYAFTSEARCAELARVAAQHGLPELPRAYADALDFQARPDRERALLDARTPPEVFRARSLELLARAHLRSEHARAAAPRDPLDYALSPARLWSDTSFLALRALRRGLLAGRNAQPAVPWRGAARERLARAAVLLAYAPRNLAARLLAARLLGLPLRGACDPDDVDLYVRLRALRGEVHASLRGDPLLGARYGRN